MQQDKRIIVTLSSDNLLLAAAFSLQQHICSHLPQSTKPNTSMSKILDYWCCAERSICKFKRVDILKASNLEPRRKVLLVVPFQPAQQRRVFSLCHCVEGVCQTVRCFISAEVWIFGLDQHVEAGVSPWNSEASGPDGAVRLFKDGREVTLSWSDGLMARTTSVCLLPRVCVRVCVRQRI